MSRFDAGKFDESIEVENRANGIENYQLSLDDTSEFSFLLHDCGYRNLFSRNLVVTIVLVSICFALLITFIIIDCTRAPPKKPKKLKQPPVAKE